MLTITNKKEVTKVALDKYFNQDASNRKSQIQGHYAEKLKGLTNQLTKLQHDHLRFPQTMSEWAEATATVMANQLYSQAAERFVKNEFDLVMKHFIQSF